MTSAQPLALAEAAGVRIAPRPPTQQVHTDVNHEAEHQVDRHLQQLNRAEIMPYPDSITMELSEEGHAHMVAHVGQAAAESKAMLLDVRHDPRRT